GIVSIDAAGSLVATQVTGNGPGRDVFLSARGGNLTAGLITDVGNTVFLFAESAVLDVNAGTNNVAAAKVMLEGRTGVGAAADPIETAVSNLEAFTETGGIFVANTGDVVLGGSDPTLNGVQVGTSGDIRLVNAGSISVTGTVAERVVSA